MGAVRSSGGGDADQAFGIGAVDDSKEMQQCAARLVDELKVDRGVAERFARARQGEFKEAKLLLEEDLVWRAQKTPVMQADCQTTLASGAWRSLGCTPAGSPVLFLNVGLSDPSKYDVDEYERYITYFFENMFQMGGERTAFPRPWIMIWNLR